MLTGREVYEVATFDKELKKLMLEIKDIYTYKYKYKYKYTTNNKSALVHYIAEKFLALDTYLIYSLKYVNLIIN